MTRVLLSCVAVILLVVMVLGSVQAQEEFFEKYAFTKAMEQCLGTENYHNYLRNAQEAIQFCATQPRTRLLAAHDVTYSPFDNQGQQTPYRKNNGGGYFPTTAGITTSQVRRPLAGISTSRVKYPIKSDDTGFVSHTGIHSTTTGGSGGSGQDGVRRPYNNNNNPFFTNSYQPDTPYIITGGQDNQRDYNSYQPDTPYIITGGQDNQRDYNTYNYRPSVFDTNDIPVYRPYDTQVGNQLWDAESIRSAVDRFDSAMSNFTCVLAAVSAIGRDLSVMVESFANYYYSLQLDVALRKDLIQGVHFCNSATMCLQPDLLGIPLPANLQRTFSFLKCEKKTRLAACLKHDVRRHISQFDVRVLPSDGGRTSNVDKLTAILVGSDASDDLELY